MKINSSSKGTDNNQRTKWLVFDWSKFELYVDNSLVTIDPASDFINVMATYGGSYDGNLMISLDMTKAKFAGLDATNDQVKILTGFVAQSSALPDVTPIDNIDYDYPFVDPDPDYTQKSIPKDKNKKKPPK